MSLEKIFKRFDKNNEEIDLNGNGQINANEFVSWFEKILKISFDVCDVDGNGKITAKELHLVMKTHQRSVCRADSNC
ncbi:hypothetical protein YC2023_068820 [Brassica napus]